MKAAHEKDAVSQCIDKRQGEDKDHDDDHCCVWVISENPVSDVSCCISCIQVFILQTSSF